MKTEQRIAEVRRLCGINNSVFCCKGDAEDNEEEKGFFEIDVCCSICRFVPNRRVLGCTLSVCVCARVLFSLAPAETLT